MTTYSVPVTTDYNCKDYSPNCYTGSGASYVSCGQRGVTYWGPDNTRSINPNYGTFTWTFTGEQPRCYQDKDNCNVSFNLFTGGNASDNDVGPLRIYLNGNDIGTDIWHSKYQGHDLSIAVELANSGYLDDNGPNTLKFENRDTEVSMSIALLEILQVYGMCGLTCDNFPGSSDCSGCGAKNPPCQSYSYTGYTGLDSTKSIHPCNKSYGDRSFTKFHTSSPCTIPYNNSCTLTWQNPSTPSANYVGSSKCLFNFNQCSLSTGAAESDVTLDVYLNNSYIGSQYLSNVLGHRAFPSINLAQFGGSYRDNPGSLNTLVVYNRSSNANVIVGPGTDNGVDVYRVYRTNL